jgi:GT2 family glycosyltransferase
MTDNTAIILINYNNYEDTLQCLKSISDAGYKQYVVVVDNCSTVSGVDYIKDQYPDTILIKNNENLGFGRANNIGIDWALKNTRCEYVFILNNDTIIDKFTIPNLENVLQQHPDAGIAAPRIVMMENPNSLWYGGGEINWTKGSAKIPGYFGPANSSGALKARYVTFASGCAMFVRRCVFENLGGFDQRFFMYVEDVELCIRVIKNGYNIFYTPDAIVKHKGQGSQRKDNNFYSIEHPKNPKLPFFVYHLTKNRILTSNLHACGTNAIKFWTMYPVFIVKKFFQYLIYGRFDAICAMKRGIMDSFKDRI